MFVVLALLAALILGTLLVFRHWGELPPQTAVPGAAENPSTPEAGPPLVPSASDRTPQSAAEAKYVLTISAREGSWVKVVADLGAPAEYELKAGDRLRLEAQTKFNLLIGNAGGVALVLNDKPVPVPGKRGEIVNLHLP